MGFITSNRFIQLPTLVGKSLLAVDNVLTTLTGFETISCKSPVVNRLGAANGYIFFTFRE